MLAPGEQERGGPISRRHVIEFSLRWAVVEVALPLQLLGQLGGPRGDDRRGPNTPVCHDYLF
jgi:hypothetical protein